MPRTLVFTATYNEVDNIEQLVREIFQYLPGQEILVIDDSSPDGTGDLLDTLSADNPNIHVIHRPSKLGLGTAHLLAMKYAIHGGFDFLITMDADFSHHPKYLPTMAKLLEENDFVIGSRYASGGRCDYGLLRIFVSRTANTLARFFLGIPTHEATTSYRGFPITLLKRMDLNSIRSNGYSFFMESIFVVTQTTRNLAEFPIHFEDRRAGTSKISKQEVLKAMYNLIWMFFRRFFVLPRFLKRLEEPTSDPVIPCENCRSIHHMEMMTEKTSDKNDASVYQCTSTGHRTHGRILKCLHCGLAFNETRHNADQIIEFYADVEDQTYLKNIDSRFLTFRHNFAKLKSFLPPTGKLLDIGSYCGVSLKVAGEYGYNTLGLEPSKWAARYSEEVMQEKVFRGILKDLPEEAGPFDIVTMWDVLEHVPHPLEELKRIHSRLKPGGIFAFSTLNIDNWYPKIMRKRWPWYMDMHLYYFTRDSMRQLLDQAGLDLIHQQSYTHIITFEYFLLKLDALGIPGARFFSAVVKKTPLPNIMIPFSFGDIQLFVCKKREDVS